MMQDCKQAAKCTVAPETPKEITSCSCSCQQELCNPSSVQLLKVAIDLAALMQ